MTFDALTRQQTQQLFDEQTTAYAALKDVGLSLDITRGKPSAAQLDLSNGLLELPGPGHFTDEAGIDVRNYGGLKGLPEIRSIFADLLGVPIDQLVAGNNSSLQIMHDTLVYCLLHGTTGSPRPWSKEKSVKFLCPVPGYDRHFALCEEFGIEMIAVPSNDDGPDVHTIRQLVEADPQIKGIWMVPTYANPSGATCSAEVAAALTSMPTAAPDFRIFWDNGYVVHHITDVETKSADAISLAAAGQHPDRVFMYASTSKITFAGAGVGFFASSPANVAWYLAHLGKASIGPDKVNQLRHAMFLKDAAGVRSLMARHREIIAPKFEIVLSILDQRLGDHGVARWTKPKGGYFVSLDVMPGTASRVVELAKAAGIALTPAGASYPYGHDPEDRNIRIAPTLPTVDDVAAAIEGLTTCVLLAAAEQALR